MEPSVKEMLHRAWWVCTDCLGRHHVSECKGIQRPRADWLRAAEAKKETPEEEEARLRAREIEEEEEEAAAAAKKAIRSKKGRR